jgi:hypothetical protein
MFAMSPMKLRHSSRERIHQLNRLAVAVREHFTGAAGRRGCTLCGIPGGRNVTELHCAAGIFSFARPPSGGVLGGPGPREPALGF